MPRHSQSRSRVRTIEPGSSPGRRPAWPPCGARPGPRRSRSPRRRRGSPNPRPGPSAPPVTADRDRSGPGDQADAPTFGRPGRDDEVAVVDQDQPTRPGRLRPPTDSSRPCPRGDRTRPGRGRRPRPARGRGIGVGEGGRIERRARFLAASGPMALAFEGPPTPRPTTRPSGSASQAVVEVPPPSTPRKRGRLILSSPRVAPATASADLTFVPFQELGGPGRRPRPGPRPGPA